MPCIRYQVGGRVQRVGYRMWAQAEALSIGITGYVKNLPDGDVEVVACGTLDSLARLESRLNIGPSYSRVDAVLRDNNSVFERDFESFEIRFR